MLRLPVVLLCVFVIGCQGPRGPQGDPGNPGSNTNDAGPVPDGGTEATRITCNPGESLCVNNHLWSCNLSGNDAAHIADCGSGTSATNPGICSTSACPVGQTACCTTTHDSCMFTMMSPNTEAGSSPSSFCFSGGVPATPTCGSFIAEFQYNISVIPGVCATSATDTVIVVLDRIKRMPGTFVPMVGEVSYLSTPISCSSWTGNVHWISDAPTWAVDVDLTCTQTGPANGLRLIASMHGQL